MVWLYSSAILIALLLGAPLFILIGGSAILAFVMFEGANFAGLSPVAEQIRGLADQQTLLAIPFFMLSGAIMSAGDISKRLIRWARAVVGWMPGGMALSGIGACLLFASITGSSTATLVAIGGLVYPALRKENYGEEFSIGLVTSAGSLGILVPPSIPMLIYCIFNTSTKVEVEKLWLAGVGPALLIAICLGGYSMAMSVKFKSPRYKFSIKELGAATRDGFWALMLPGLILGGIYSGVFTAIEAAAASVVYSVLVEIYFHGGLKWRDIPRVFAETITLVGSFIVIVVMAMALKEYFTAASIPERAAAWITGLNLSPFWFLFAVDMLLLVVGCLMDILSALMVFVPLIAPMAAAVGIDPIHLGLIFIVNLGDRLPHAAGRPQLVPLGHALQQVLRSGRQIHRALRALDGRVPGRGHLGPQGEPGVRRVGLRLQAGHPASPCKRKRPSSRSRRNPARSSHSKIYGQRRRREIRHAREKTRREVAQRSNGRERNRKARRSTARRREEGARRREEGQIAQGSDEQNRRVSDP